MSGDLIRRQDAIKILTSMMRDCFPEAEEELDAVVTTVREIPSVEPERKKGRWVQVGGYFTPGGDPVWKCSECGKGMHVYGIEAPSYNRDYADGQWVACPNCGADMEGEQ